MSAMFSFTAMEILAYTGVCVFVITGTLVAARKNMDIISFFLIGTVTGIGGGTMRDLILDRPVFWIQDDLYLPICAVTSFLMFFVASFISRKEKYIIWADAVGMALFTVAGTQIAIEHGTTLPVAVLLGMMTATFGGIIRDVLSNEDSMIMRKEIYITACFAGSSLYAALYYYTQLQQDIMLWSSVCIAFCLRALAIIYKITLPGYHVNN